MSAVSVGMAYSTDLTLVYQSSMLSRLAAMLRHMSADYEAEGLKDAARTLGSTRERGMHSFVLVKDAGGRGQVAQRKAARPEGCRPRAHRPCDGLRRED